MRSRRLVPAALAGNPGEEILRGVLPAGAVCVL